MISKNTWRAGFLLFFLGVGAASGSKSDTLTVGNRQVPIEVTEGFTVEALDIDLRGPRMLAFASNGDLLIGSKTGLVYRFVAPYNKAETLVNFGGYPHSIAFRMTAKGEELWLAETSGLYRTNYQPGRTYQRQDFSLVAPLPGGGGHTSRTVNVGPDNRIYVALGITGNCSNEYLAEEYPFNARRGGIFVLDESLASPQLKTYANGLRNPIGFAWNPATNLMYANNNGPDHLGFEEPQEVIVEVEDGDFFGMPWYQFVEGELIRDQCITAAAPQPPANVKAPLTLLPARSAPMALAFPKETDMGGRFKGHAFVAIRGSWGTPPAGGVSGSIAGRRQPRIITIPINEANLANPQLSELVTGFQYDNGQRWARSVGLAFGPDGFLYFTSDEGIQGLFRVKLAD